MPQRVCVADKMAVVCALFPFPFSPLLFLIYMYIYIYLYVIYSVACAIFDQRVYNNLCAKWSKSHAQLTRHEAGEKERLGERGRGSSGLTALVKCRKQNMAIVFSQRIVAYFSTVICSCRCTLLPAFNTSYQVYALPPSPCHYPVPRPTTAPYSRLLLFWPV